MQKLYHLWYVDGKARRGIHVWTILIAFGYGVLNSVALGRSEQEVTWETLGLVCVLTTGFSILYCFKAETKRVSSFVRLAEVFQNRKVLHAGLAFTVVLVLLSVASQIRVVQAAVINVRFKQILSSPYLFEPSSIDKIVSIVDTAKSSQVPISPALVNVASRKFLEAAPSNPGAWQGALTLANYRSSSNKESLPPHPTRSCIKNENTNGITGHVSDSRLSNCIQELDHLEWKDTVFENVTVVYHGGPSVLENVRFYYCQFSVDNNPFGERLAQALLASDTVTIDLSGN